MKALSSGDTAPLEEFASEVDDIALLRLSEPAGDVVPASLARQADEQGQIAEVLGRGVTGTASAAKPRTRRARASYAEPASL